MKSSSHRQERVLFLLLLGFEVLHLFFLILSRRLPLGHDGFFYFYMQYFFLNDVAINKEIPLWIPYVSHGISASWFYIIQGVFGPLAEVFLLTGRLFSSVNFLDIFHYGIFVDRLLLLTGVWLLSQRYFTSAFTRFFVASCVMASTVTMTTFYFTLHLYFAIPLMLYFGHAFLDTRRWRYFFLACNLFMIQMIGNIAYFIPVISLTAFLYFLFYALDQPLEFLGKIKNLRWGISSAAGITGGLLSLGILGALLLASKDPAWLNPGYGRNSDGTASLNIFLTYAGNMDFHKWLELLLRLSPSLDFTVYMGFLALPLVLFGILYSQNRNRYPILLTALILLFFSMGTWVSVFFYYTWPMMKFYRHLGLMVPLIKLFLLFLAGFGFERILVQRDTWQGTRKISYACLVSGALLVMVSIILIHISAHGQEASRTIVNFMTVDTSQTPSTFDPHTVSYRLKEASCYALLTGLFFIFLPLISFKKSAAAIILGVLIVNTADIYGYYCTEINERSFALNKDKYKITAFSPMPYTYRRLVDAPNPREIIISSPIKFLSLYSTTNAFLFQDALATRFRTLGHLKPLYDMMSAFGPRMVENPAFLKIAGSSADKIQFFKQACFDGDDKQLASYLGSPKYKGNLLFVSGKQTNSTLPCSTQIDLSANDRIKATYQIVKFTPNILELSVNVPSSKPIWMMYADVWHQGWKAQINGQAVPILKADMAYKTVLLAPGKNTVTFAFTAPGMIFLEHVIAVNALGWLIILLYLVVGIQRRGLTLI